MPQIDTLPGRTLRPRSARAAGHGVRSASARATEIAVLAVVAWGVLAFGAVYPWAYWPLLAGAVLVGGLAYGVGAPAHRLTREMLPIVAALAVIAGAATLQIVPLPASVRTAISPATEPFLRSTDVPYAAAAALQAQGADSQPLPHRSLSVHPAATGRAVALLAGFTALLVGLTRYFARHGVRGVVPAITGLGVIVALIGIVQKAVLGDHAWMGMKIYGIWAPHYKLTTPFGPFVNKNHYAGWMVMTLPLALGYLMGLAESGAARIRPRWRDRLLWLSSPEGGRLQLTAFAIVIMGAALALTKSRSGIACFVLTIAAAGVTMARGQRSGRMRVSILAGVVMLTALPLLWANVDLATRFTSGGESVELRRQAWGDALAVMRDFPIAGTGLNTYGSATLLYNTADTDLHFQEAHNDYVQLAAEGGLLLGIPALVAIVACVRAVRRRLSEDRPDPMRYWIRFGAATGLAAIALQSAVEFSLQMPGNAVLFVVLCGVALHERAAPADAVRPVTRAG